ncbi:DUF2877 domain-containing protein [Cellulomonas sp. zg-ZUI22]|uniref:oxamate carbamoyltransferase subunit AllH family protein n=1 Tax=Cellulomonas sp. zg-ZUI22 TaxID=2816955 RepID=UPI001A953C6A|nr:DUF2877 domain-containing protein [Cellulomonas sp. zg-ZUI22]MBO0900763.1 DUF2877 domain-containing protein [Cellulomonas sp. zg-ZUI22]
MPNTHNADAGRTRLAADAPPPHALLRATVVRAGRSLVVLRTAGGALVPVTSPEHGLVPGGVCLGGGLRGLAPRAGTTPDPGPWAAHLDGAPRVDLAVPVGAVDAHAARALLAGALGAEPARAGRDVMDPRPARRRAGELVAAAVAQDPRRVRTALRRLVGVGPGSTPSGDDVVVGVLAGLDRRSAGAAAAVVRGALPVLLDRTTSLSRHTLVAALRWQVAERVHTLVEATAAVGLVPATLAAARTWGATSGLDLAAGVAAGALAGPAQASSCPADARRRSA